MTLSHRNALRAMTRAKNAPRAQGKFAPAPSFNQEVAEVQIKHILTLRTKFQTLLVQTNASEAWAKAIVNTLATALRHSLPPLEVQVEVFQTVLTHLEALIQQHPGYSFGLETALNPILAHPAVAPGYERQKQNPESEYWAALALGLGNDYACEYGQAAHHAFLDAHDYLHQSWQAMHDLVAQALMQVNTTVER